MYWEGPSLHTEPLPMIWHGILNIRFEISGILKVFAGLQGGSADGGILFCLRFRGLLVVLY